LAVSRDPEPTQPERRARDRHPIRNYLFFAILAIAAIVFLGLKIESASGGPRAATLGEDSAPASCRQQGGLVLLPDVSEASGVAVSRRTPGLLWTHKDQGTPVLFALDESGAVKGRVTVAGPTLQDWEDLAAGPCGGGAGESCLYLADIGDNDARRKNITVYRVREPAPGDQATQRADAFTATYPDGPQDAEALLVSKEGHILIVTKGESGPVAVYRFPEPLHPGVSVQLEKIGTLAGGKLSKGERVTGGSVSLDGTRVALRTHGSVLFYDARQFARGHFERPLRFDLSSLGEAQGEGVALGQDGHVFLTGEGGKKKEPGSLARAVCAVTPAH
jgi:hypothetical protein